MSNSSNVFRRASAVIIGDKNEALVFDEWRSSANINSGLNSSQRRKGLNSKDVRNTFLSLIALANKLNFKDVA